MGITLKEERIEVRLAAAEKERIKHAAALVHQNISEFVLRAVSAAADQALAEQTRFVLPPEQIERFHAALDAPPRPIPELRALFAKPSVLEQRDA
ncbi:MAG: DUF1778 domain-containing protein [Betaproteobacteria bacterium]|nr:DUF1778 domain-containing protein [Betaproteobacteria bacterium]